MKKKLFYVVDLELQHVDGEIEETTGNKTVRVYEIENNVPVIFCTLDLVNTQSSEEEIQEYLDDNGHGDEMFEFVEL